MLQAFDTWATVAALLFGVVALIITIFSKPEYRMMIIGLAITYFMFGVRFLYDSNTIVIFSFNGKDYTTTILLVVLVFGSAMSVVGGWWAWIKHPSV